MSHVCPICGKSFSLLRNLTRHVKSIHEGKNHECPTCKKTFTRKSYLTTHMKLHERKDSPILETPDTVQQVSDRLVLTLLLVFVDGCDLLFFICNVFIK